MKLFLQKRLAEKHVVCIALCLFLISTLFSGYDQKTASGPGAIGSEIWEIVPLTYGVWESEALPILPWNSGQKWREVSLPEELANRENGCSNLTVSVCSDSILFHFWGENSTRVLYRISLAENELKAELCAVIGG